MKFSTSLESLSGLQQDYGSISIDISKLDMKKVELFETKHIDLVRKLDNWILYPNQNLLTYIVKLSKVVDELYSLRDITIYRGMTVSKFGSKYQETMGLTETSWLGTAKLKKGVVPGYKFDYTATRATSFSWDENIARAFGNLVVSGVSKYGSPRLVITDELAYIVSKLRKLPDPDTQREVIVLPPSKLSCKVLYV